MTILKILGLLLLTLIIIIPLIERSSKGKADDPEHNARLDKMSRWIIPLLALLVVLQMVNYWSR